MALRLKDEETDGQTLDRERRCSRVSDVSSSIIKNVEKWSHAWLHTHALNGPCSSITESGCVFRAPPVGP